MDMIVHKQFKINSMVGTTDSSYLIFQFLQNLSSYNLLPLSQLYKAYHIKLKRRVKQSGQLEITKIKKE